MRFHIANINGPKRRAKLLKRFLDGLGYDIRLGTCQNLMAKMLGYSDHQELCALAGTLPLSEGDALVDEATRTARRKHHIGVLVAGGIAPEHAVDAVEKIRPTGYRPFDPDFDPPQSLESDEDTTTFELEWGLRGANRSVVAEIKTSRTANIKRRRM